MQSVAPPWQYAVYAVCSDPSLHAVTNNTLVTCLATGHGGYMLAIGNISKYLNIYTSAVSPPGIGREEVIPGPPPCLLLPRCLVMLVFTELGATLYWEFKYRSWLTFIMLHIQQ